MTMTTELRNWYLSNLGIVQYLPKDEESVALPFHSPVAEVSDGITDEGAEAANVSRTKIKIGHAKSRAASVLELVGEKTDVSSGPEQQPPVIDHTGVASAETNALPAVSFRLACWHPCDDILVFNQLEPNGQPDQDQYQLLSNILKAVGRAPNGLPVPELLDWPIDNTVGEGVDHSESGAKAMLSVFLDARIRKHGVLWVLLMGELSSKLLSPGEGAYIDLLSKTEEISGGAQVIVVRSLQEMLAEPETKAETWQAIRRLAQQS